MASYEVGAPEKDDVTKLERAVSESSEDPRITALTVKEQKHVIWRIDRRLVIILGFMYCVSLMDRTNLGIANIAGMGVDLKLTGPRYSIITCVFFLTYVILQPPATVVLRKVGPRVFLPSITILWGMTMICFGFLRTWDQMIPLRLVLGIFEAGFFPGCAYLLSCWYPRYDLQKRNAVFYLIGSMASAFSGILAYGFYLINGHGYLGPGYGQHFGPTAANPHIKPGEMPGIAGWRWIFILQGTLTCLVGIIGALFIADFPEKAANKSRSFAIPFLNQREADFVVARIDHDRADVVPVPFTWSHYVAQALDLKVWAFAWLFMCTTVCTYALAYFLPIILFNGMGFNLAAAECLISPPYVAAAIWMYGVAIIGDKYHIRGPLIILNALLGLIGLPLLGFAKNNGVRYFGVFLATMSCNANVPTILTYQANNIRGQWKRALASATLVGFGGIGGIIGSTIFREQDKPAYRPGMYGCIIASGMIVLVVCLLSVKFYFANRRAANGGKVIEGLAGFRYTY